MAESVRVTKSGSYAEIGGNGALFATKFGVYAELDNGQLRISEIGAYLELITPPLSQWITGQTGLHVYYNDQPVGGYIQTFSLESNVKGLDSSNFVTAGLLQASLPVWLATMGGVWGRGLDDIFGAEVVGRGSSSTMYNFRVDLGLMGNQVVYTWIAGAFVGRYQSKMNIDNVMEWSAQIALSGVPTRGVSS